MNTGLETWTPDQVHKALQDNEIVLIDVRTPQEYMFEHIEGALLAPMAFIKSASLPTQDVKRIVLHCGSGARSEKVGKQCLAEGLEKMTHMSGGFAAWKKAGLPYIGTDMNTGGPKRIVPADK
jgi:rhodanese-related sulfurtransferase